MKKQRMIEVDVTDCSNYRQAEKVVEAIQFLQELLSDGKIKIKCKKIKK